MILDCATILICSLRSTDHTGAIANIVASAYIRTLTFLFSDLLWWNLVRTEHLAVCVMIPLRALLFLQHNFRTIRVAAVFFCDVATWRLAQHHDVRTTLYF